MRDFNGTRVVIDILEQRPQLPSVRVRVRPTPKK